jgi:hypothetical protein
MKRPCVRCTAGISYHAQIFGGRNAARIARGRAIGSEGAYVFVLERPGFTLTKSYYVFVIAVLLLTGSLGMLLTMHIHIAPKAPAPSRSNRKPALRPADIPECDLPPLPNREGPYDYKGYPYYSYPTGEVDGFAGREWWRVSLDEFKRHVDRVTSND